MWICLTVDGGPLGELQYETFSAAGELHFKGRNVPPNFSQRANGQRSSASSDFPFIINSRERPT